MRIAEKTLLILFIAAFTIRQFGIVGGAPFMALAWLGLVIIYLFGGFALFNGIQLCGIFKKESFQNISSAQISMAIFAGIGMFFGITGILFKAMHWPGARLMELNGLVLIFTLICIATIKVVGERSALHKRILRRAIPVPILMCLVEMVQYLVER